MKNTQIVDKIDKVENANWATDIDNIEIYGAREHNLKNIDLVIPRNKLVVITGVSGSGKSSLAFDTIYAEGQRRYLETFSSYIRQFVGGLERPDVDKINGLSPVIAIDQKTTSRNPRSTVGTVTELYDFFRLLYARAAEAFSYITGKKMEKLSFDQIYKKIASKFEKKSITLLAPIIRGRKGHYREEFEKLRKNGFSRVRIDGEIADLVPHMIVDRFVTHNIEVVIDRFIVEEKSMERLRKSLETTFTKGNKTAVIIENDTQKQFFYSSQLMDADSGISYEEPAPNAFSFNSPFGYCPKCKGAGWVMSVEIEALISNPTKPLFRGGLTFFDDTDAPSTLEEKIRLLCKQERISTTKSWNKLSPEERAILIYGQEEQEDGIVDEVTGGYWQWDNIKSIANLLVDIYTRSPSEKQRIWAERYVKECECPECKGARLKKESLHFKIAGKNIHEASTMDIKALADWLHGLSAQLSDKQNIIASEIIKELTKRIGFLLDVGLDYLHMHRATHSLSGGEAQRIRLATQIGSQLVGVLYILDEPSIGLHQRDNQRLINSLKNLRDLGNTVLVVEHDKDMMLAADYIIDIGPNAGIHGGKVIACGTPEEFLKLNSITAQFLKNERVIEVPEIRRPATDKKLRILGCQGHNLKSIDFEIPLGVFVCVTGVSGSGKSTLVNQTLYPILHKHVYKFNKPHQSFESIEGLEHIDKVIEIDQKPIGRTPRSNPATYTGLFTQIRDLFALLPESAIRGYKPGRFSFNVKGGRCETCQGGGMEVIEMNFLPDVHVQCPTCRGRRYNRETLEIRYKGRSISDVLNMTVDEGVEFFTAIPNINRKLVALQEVGLGYITIGQSSTTLSGGEAQRMKIATELSKRSTGKTFYILDEPTTGLHFQDVEQLLKVLNRLVGNGNTVLVIEHNLDVIKVADWIIDIGPEGGNKGGTLVAEGTPEAVALCEASHTGKFLKLELNT